jgi:hypothetical protein
MRTDDRIFVEGKVQTRHPTAGSIKQETMVVHNSSVVSMSFAWIMASRALAIIFTIRCQLTQMTRPTINGATPAPSHSFSIGASMLPTPTADELTPYKVSERRQICARSLTNDREIGFDESSCEDRG